MGWNVDQGIEVTSAFRGITAPLRELFDEVHQRGWDVQKVDTKDGQYEATVKNPYGETISKVGPDPATAVGHCLVGIMRQETMRYPRTAAWKSTWEHQLPEIAKAYADAPTYDPKAAAAWKELGEDSLRRAEAIGHQLNVEYTDDPYPYEDVNEMAKDIGEKQHINVSKANIAHPLWSTQQALAYRLVHDVLGHAQVGGDWGWHGENGATAAHMPLLSPEAQKALFTEAIGQCAHNHFYRALGPQKVAFLDDFLEPLQEQEGSAGFGGIHPSQSIVPTNIPSIEDKISKIGANPIGLEPWSWGNWGKGFIHPESNNIITWNTDNQGNPVHLDIARGTINNWVNKLHKGRQSVYQSPITIAPNGEYTTALGLNSTKNEPDGEETRFASEITPLRYQPDPQAWLTKHQPSGDYGHAPYLLGSRMAFVGNLDPNDGWSSGVEPLPDNAYLWQREEGGRDPLDYQGVKDQAHQLGTNWAQLHNYDGYPDLDSQRQAVVNAFRSVLLSPRQTPRWAATHYQNILDVPAKVSDPLRFADALNVHRAAHNEARGLPEGIHESEWLPQKEALRSWVKGMNPNLDDSEVDDIVKRELFHMIAEEEERITADDPGGHLLPMQINDAVNKALRKRLAVATKPRIDQKFDFGRDRLFHEAFQAPDPGIYGDFLHSHIRPIAGVGLHSDRILRAARDDVAQHGGKGHHFRAQVSDLIPGVGPRQISHAWSLLQPHTSQLAVITPSVQNTLGYDHDTQVPVRDYYKLERELAAARDAAGYSHVPLGQFSTGMYDYANYGHRTHRDLSPFKVLNPTPYDQVDWTQYPNLPTQPWEDPYWFQSSQPLRDQIGKDWDQMVAVNHPAEQIPYRTAASPTEWEGQDFTNGVWSLPQSARGVLRAPYVTHPQSGEIIEGDPNLSLMQHAKNVLGLTTEEIWAADPEIGRR